MANVPGLKKVGAFWHYSIQVNGQRSHGSTKATDLATARMVLEKMRRELLHGQLRVTKQVSMTMNLVFEAWRKAHLGSFSLKHLSSVDCRYQKWVRPQLGFLKIDKVSTSAVLQLRARQLEAGCSGRYANNTLELVRTLSRFAIKLGQISTLPFELKPLRLQKQPRPTLPAFMVATFFREIEAESRNPHIPAILMAMIGLGLRESETLGMRWEWFDSQARTYTVGKAKGKEARVLPVPDWLWFTIFAMPSPVMSDWVFPAEDGAPHRSQFCKKVLRRVCSKLGLGNLTQHRLRATFASLHAEAGTPITEIQGMLGHKSITTTMIYVEQSLDAKRKAQINLSNRLGFVQQD